MKRLPLLLLALTMVGGAVALSGTDKQLTTHFEREDRNPVTHLRWNQQAGDFQFAIVSDRTGSHRANVFTQAVAKLNLLQPEFVITVGDLIEGTKDKEQLQSQWREFDALANRLSMPFFYVAGNHDVGNKESSKFWEAKLGRRYYHFLYRNVLFLVLNTDDLSAAIGKEQFAWAEQILKANPAVRWTMVFLHRPLWNIDNPAKNGWGDVEKALAGRAYTVFAGHVHHFQKFVRQGRNYYQLATTGGGSLMRGVSEGEFDHVVWVSMKQSGPVLANLLLDGIQAEDLSKFPTDEPGKKVTRKPTFPVHGKVLFEGAPVPGAQVIFQPPSKAKLGARAIGVVAADGSFTLTTYAGDDGAAEGDYQVTVVWRQPRLDANGKPGPNLLPPRYAKTESSGLTARVQPGRNDLVLELKK